MQLENQETLKAPVIWESIILLLSIYVLAELSIEIIYPFSEKTLYILEIIDIAICGVFLGDFFYFLFKVNSKKDYFKSRWIDLISSIPFSGIFRVLRVVRVVRAFRILKLFRIIRGLKGLGPIIRFINKTKGRSILISYILILIVVDLYCSLAFYSFEVNFNDNVKSFFDAFWWSFTTITTVGYGDIFPVTTAGRVIGMILTILGIGLFSLVTAELSTYLIKISKNE